MKKKRGQMSDREFEELMDEDLLLDEEMALEEEMALDDEVFYQALRAKREEQAAYADFIASLDMEG